MIRVAKCRRIVVKVGTSSLTHSTGKIDLRGMERLVRQIADVHNSGREVILVTSGAVGVGMGKLNFKTAPRNIQEKQALAAVGQGGLMHLYEKFFAEYNKHVAQILITREVFAHPIRYLNVQNTLTKLLEFGVIPIINENDSIAVEELRFGDNDTLSAMVASNADADLLIILSDIDGLYDANPRTTPHARIIPVVREVSDEMLAAAQGKGSHLASGGMYTKLLAARMTMACGIPLVIAAGDLADSLRQILAGEEVGTRFIPRNRRSHPRRRWIAVGSIPEARIYVDDGAAQALRRGRRSLLPSGVVSVEGYFEPGEVVAVIAPEGQEIARGIVNFSSAEVAQLAGKHSREIKTLLGRDENEEVIHRNDLVLIQAASGPAVEAPAP